MHTFLLQGNAKTGCRTGPEDDISESRSDSYTGSDSDEAALKQPRALYGIRQLAAEIADLADTVSPPGLSGSA